jgi:hypothetical protein
VPLVILNNHQQRYEPGNIALLFEDKAESLASANSNHVAVIHSGHEKPSTLDHHIGYMVHHQGEERNE